jgi:biotin synthase
MSAPLQFPDLLAWLREDKPERLNHLWTWADEVRRAHVGDSIHLRGLVEIASRCVRQCAYCGLRAGNHTLARYRMEPAEILAAARQAVALGYGTVVLQAGEDFSLSCDWVSDIIRQIKAETRLAVTLSLGERTEVELEAWRKVGADRYLLRFETSDSHLFERIHPPRTWHAPDRLTLLRRLQQLGYEIGSGIMVGLPGQTFESVARDLLLFRELDLDMIGIGPFIPHPQTPLGNGELQLTAPPDQQVPNTELMVYKAVALTRIMRPDANIPSTTALATINKRNGRELGLQRGANVLMPNLTPIKYRRLYEIYPAKACIDESDLACHRCLGMRIAQLGRQVGQGPGGRRPTEPMEVPC